MWELKRKDIQGPARSCCSYDDKQTKRFPNFEYLLLPEDLQEEYNKLSPDQHHQIERSLCFRNGSVVEYNPILSAILGCNTNYSFLGSDSQARCACCYVIKYITKNCKEITSILPLAYKARCSVDKYPSKAADSGTELRNAIYFTNACLNQITGLEEISGEMAASDLIAIDAETITHRIRFAFVTAALANVEFCYQQRKRPQLTIKEEFAPDIFDVPNLLEDFVEQDKCEEQSPQVLDDNEIHVYEPFQNVNNETAETCDV